MTRGLWEKVPYGLIILGVLLTLLPFASCVTAGCNNGNEFPLSWVIAVLAIPAFTLIGVGMWWLWWRRMNAKQAQH